MIDTAPFQSPGTAGFVPRMLAVKRPRLRRGACCLLVALMGAVPVALGQTGTATITAKFELVDLTHCPKPVKAPPPPPKESEWQLSVARRLVDLDGTGACVVMDFWTERVSKREGAGMLTATSRMLRWHKRQWKPFLAYLDYFPFAVRARQDHTLYLVNLDTDSDHGAIIGGIPQVFKRLPAERAWFDDSLILQYRMEPAPAVQGEVLQALAVLLVQRAGGVHKLSLYDRERVLLALRVAQRELAAENRIPLTADGMPVL